jgi:site-specific DNA-cytosine methylase
MKLLELFKGTGSVGKVAKRMGFKIVSLDFEEKYKATITTDILNWDYKAYHKNNNYIPDYIWASPPCNTFSPLAYPRKERNTQTAEPISERAKIGTKILYKTLEIIKYFLDLNPNMKYCIENPQGMMRKDKQMKELYRETTFYALYGDTKWKMTDFWSNYILDLKKPIKANVDKSKMKLTAYLPLNQRYYMPPKLIRQILNQYMKTIQN